jgi:uncharacterized protein YjbI with pentapeptide repeats
LHVLKRWAAVPQGIRWLVGGIAGVVLALAIAWVLLVPAADWLAIHDVGSVTGPGRAARLQGARDAARGRLLTLGAGLFAAGALIYTGRNFTLSRRQVEYTENRLQRALELIEQGQVTDRYTKAIEQLGSDKLDVRIGGIYALERVARDSVKDHPTVMEVMTAFVREHSREQSPAPESADTPAPKRRTRPDVQAALTVIGRRDAKHDRRPIDLIGADLTGADLSGAELADANLISANLTGAYAARVNLAGANLPGANLTKADLSGAIFREANLPGAQLTEAFMPGADLHGAHLQKADLARASLTSAVLARAHLHRAKLTRANLIEADLASTDLVGADLTRANLARANLTSADLTSADLTSANLTSANLAEANLGGAMPIGTDIIPISAPRLSGADLTEALWPRERAVPKGWQLDTNSGRLKRADSA